MEGGPSAATPDVSDYKVRLLRVTKPSIFLLLILHSPVSFSLMAKSLFTQEAWGSYPWGCTGEMNNQHGGGTRHTPLNARRYPASDYFLQHEEVCGPGDTSYQAATSSTWTGMFRWSVNMESNVSPVQSPPSGEGTEAQRWTKLLQGHPLTSDLKPLGWVNP